MNCKKKCFQTRKEAKKEMKDLNHWREKKLTNIYWCDTCSAFHLTSMDKNKSREYTRKNNA